MAARRVVRSATILVCLLAAGTAQAQYAGTLPGNTTWTAAQSPIQVTGNLNVPAGVTLTIQPGVVVRFAVSTTLTVGGTLVARGTSAEPITFTADHSSVLPGFWMGIDFTDSSTDAVLDGSGNYVSGSILEQAIVEGAGISGSLRGAAINVFSSAPLLSNLAMRKNRGFAARANSGATLRVRNSDVRDSEGFNTWFANAIIEGNRISGPSLSTHAVGLDLLAESTGSTVIRNNTIVGMGQAVYVVSCGTTVLAGNVVTGNRYGIEFHRNPECSSTVSIDGNTIRATAWDHPLTAKATGALAVTGNVITGNSSFGAVASLETDGALTFTGNVIADNHGSEIVWMLGRGTAPVTHLLSGNVITRNIGTNAGVHLWEFLAGTVTFTRNTVTRNRSSAAVELQVVPPGTVVSDNNIFDNLSTYALRINRQGPPIDARNTWWGTPDPAAIQALIYDGADDAHVPLIDVSSPLTSPSTSSPVAPPVGVTAVSSGPGSVTLSWTPNPEADVAGYRVFYRSTVGGPPYDGVGASEGDSPIDVGSATTVTLTGLAGDVVATVTAYDANRDGITDLTDGNESWYAPSAEASANPLPGAGRYAIRVTDSVTGAGISTRVQVRRSPFTTVVWEGMTDAAGNATTLSLPPGAYYVRTVGTPTHGDRITLNTPCDFNDCEAGTAVTLAADSTVPVSFTLERRGAIAGVVVDTVTGLPVPGVLIEVPGKGRSARTNGLGQYRIENLAPGSYELRARGGGHMWEVHDGCVVSGCSGTPVVVAPSQTTTIDWSLIPSPPNGFFGTVWETGTNGRRLANVTVQVFTLDGTLAGSDVTDANGRFFVPMPFGQYYLRTSNTQGFIDQQNGSPSLPRTPWHYDFRLSRGPLALSSITADRAAPQVAGTTTTFTATATGGLPPYQYKWWIYNGSTWVEATGWVSSNTFAWTPAAAHPGYQMGAWVRSSGVTTNSPENSASARSVAFSITAPAPLSLTSLNANRTSPQVAGTTITFTATGSGGTAPYQYKWWIFNGTGWTAATGWTSDNTLSWTPATANSSYRLGVWMRSAGSTTDAPASGNATGAASFVITAPPGGPPAGPLTVTGVTANRASPQPAGTAIVFTAAGTGGTTPYQYKWWVFNGTEWTAAGGWTTDNTLTWTPGTAGNYRVGVWMRNAGASADAPDNTHATGVAAFAITGGVPTPLRVTSLGANRASPQPAGTAITFTVTAAGGTAPYQYKWWLFDGTGWTAVTGWVTDNTFTWAPASSHPGYRVGVWVRNAGSTADIFDNPLSNAAIAFPVSAP